MIQYIKFGQNPSLDAGKLFLVKIWHSKYWCDLENEVTKSFLPHVPMVFLCKISQNPPIVSGDRVQTMLIFSLYSVVTLKIRSRSPKSDQIFKPSQHYNIWSLARMRHLVQEIWCRQAFWSKFYSFYSVVTLKIRSRSPKSNQIFKPSQRYNI